VTAAEHVDVQMVHRLAAVAADVDDQPIASLGDPFSRRQLRAGREDLADQVVVRLG
jgi:hypothetical protein